MSAQNAGNRFLGTATVGRADSRSAARTSGGNGSCVVCGVDLSADRGPRLWCSIRCREVLRREGRRLAPDDPPHLQLAKATSSRLVAALLAQ